MVVYLQVLLEISILAGSILASQDKLYSMKLSFRIFKLICNLMNGKSNLQKQAEYLLIF